MQNDFLVISRNLPKSILEVAIEEIGLSVRLTDILEELGFRTINDLISAPLASIFQEDDPNLAAINRLVSVLNAHAVPCEPTLPAARKAY